MAARFGEVSGAFVRATVMSQPSPIAPMALEPVTPLTPGAVVAERYRVVRRIGRGGMGDVYEVVDERTDRLWAMKTMRGDADGDANRDADRTGGARAQGERGEAGGTPYIPELGKPEATARGFALASLCCEEGGRQGGEGGNKGRGASFGGGPCCAEAGAQMISARDVFAGAVRAQ